MPTRGKSFWKFNNSLTSNAEYVAKMKNQIFENLRTFDKEKKLISVLKYKIRKFTMNFSKNLVKE